ncbi:hypothetical protein [Egicoccus halophilus]|uniref:hypothetical protein n=1 Tax=Egicoccus halophilus TaxID=1670830 RepID=UPI00103085DB|nr:hypothetical protein [Egicoccus halophilus]
MSETPPPEVPFRIDLEPFADFEVGVLVERPAYAPDETVRITVTATNAGDRFVEHRYPGWQRYVLSVRDEYHRVVADDTVHRGADGPALDRWLPGQMLVVPTYWNQTTGAVVPGWSDQPPGPRAEPGRYRVRVTWLGREPNSGAGLPDAFSRWFTLT